jgi:hypothetical protein
MSRAGLERKLVTWPACGCAAAGTRALRRKDWACEDRAEVGAEATREPRPEKKKALELRRKEMFLSPFQPWFPFPLRKGESIFSSTSDKEPFPFHPRLAKEDRQLRSTRGKGRTETPCRTRLASGKYTARSTCAIRIPHSLSPKEYRPDQPASLLRGGASFWDRARALDRV